MDTDCAAKDRSLVGTRSRQAPVIRLALLAVSAIPVYLGMSRIGDNLRPNHPKLGIAGVLLGFLIALAATLWRREDRPLLVYPEPDPRLRKRFWWLFPAFVLAGLTYYVGLTRRFSVRIEAYLWLTSLAVLIIPFWIRRRRVGKKPVSSGAQSNPSDPPQEKTSRNSRHGWIEVAAFVFLFAVALAYRLPYLERYPVPIHNDEASCALMGRSIVEEWRAGGVDWFRLRPFAHFPTFDFLPSALFQGLFSPNLFAHRLANVVLSMVTLGFLYLLLRDFLGPGAGLLGLGLAGTGHFALHWSRSGISHGHAAFLTVICGWLLWKAVKTGGARWFILTGVFLAACLVTYQGALVIPLWLGILVAIAWTISPSFRRRYTTSLPLILVSAIIALSPMAATYTKEPGHFLSRRGSLVFTKDEGTIEHMKSSYGENYLPNTLRANLKNSLLAFHRPKDSCQEYGCKVGGMLDSVTAALFVVGLAVAVARPLNPRFGAFLSIIVLNWLMGGILAVPAPHFSRLSGMAFVIYSIPLFWGWELLQNGREAGNRLGTVLVGSFLAAGLVVVALLNFRLYFVDFDRQEPNRNEALRSSIALDTRNDGPANITYVLTDRFPTGFSHESQQFVGGSRRVLSFAQPDEMTIPRDAGLSSATFIIPVDDNGLLEKLRQRFPNGRLEERILPHYNPEHIYNRYIVPLPL
jgi:hypothetical protein